MPIRINLLAEDQAAEEMRRKNPVKLGIWIGSFMVFIMLLWIFKLHIDIHFSQQSYKLYDDSWKAAAAKYGSVTNNNAKISDADIRLNALDRLATNRFYWASVLNALQQTMIKDIQITRITGVQKYTKEDPRTIGSGPTAKKIPGSMTEAVSIYIDGKDYNPAAQNYDKFKETLCNYGFFVKGLGRRDGFVLETVSSPSADASDPSRQYAVFKLVSRYPEVRRE